MSMSDNKVSCPICSGSYSMEEIEIHADLCVSLKAEAPQRTKAKKQGTLSKYFGVCPVPTVTDEDQPDAVKKYFIRSGHYKQFPNVKRVIGTNFIVDGFDWGKQSWCTAWFLTHFHSDHYQGLGDWFEGKLYCSSTTANLVMHRLSIPPELIFVIELNTEYMIDGISVTALDANHCPGSVMLIFRNPKTDGQTILHTGDCRAETPLLESCKAHLTRHFFEYIYLDTTYCDPRYCFPSQEMCAESCIEAIRKILKVDGNRLLPLRRLFVVGTYLIGKERIALALSRYLGIPISAASRYKHKILRCLEWPELQSSISDSMTDLRLVPLDQVSKRGLSKYLQEGYDQIVGVKPTGWTFHRNRADESCTNTRFYEIKPGPHCRATGSLVIIEVPYSEHSSFAELQGLLEFVSFAGIIPTVGNYSGRCLRLAEYSNSPRRLLESWCSCGK